MITNHHYTDTDITKSANLAEAIAEIADGAVPTVAIEPDGDGVWLELLDAGTEDTLSEYWIQDADGGSDRDRERAIEEADEIVSKLGIEVK